MLIISMLMLFNQASHSTICCTCRMSHSLFAYGLADVQNVHIIFHQVTRDQEAFLLDYFISKLVGAFIQNPIGSEIPPGKLVLP